MDKKLVYCNRAIVSYSSFDFQLLLENYTDGTADETITIKMSPQHAKAFSDVLADTISRYESVYGTINFKPLATAAVDTEIPAATPSIVEEESK